MIMMIRKKIKMYKNIVTKLLLLTISVSTISACQTTAIPENVEVKFFKAYEKKYKTASFPVEVSFPTNSVNKPVPLIITQHGSEQDGRVFANGEGQTDEFSTRLILMANKRGFAVAAIDAFYNKNLKSTDKIKFPHAEFYAYEVKKWLEVDNRIDRNAVFFTGFSYGASTVLQSTAIETGFINRPWQAVAAAEPSCNVFPLPKKIGYPILILKGGESHLQPKPCEMFRDFYEKKGSKVSLILFPHSNHYFSRNGTILDTGIALNGCANNPVFIQANGKHTFSDGTKAPLELIRKRCFTQQSGSGKSREDLDIVITEIIDFFENNLKK